MPPSNRAADNKRSMLASCDMRLATRCMSPMSHRLIVDDNDPLGPDVDVGEGDVELDPVVPDGRFGPLDGERLRTIGALAPQPCTPLLVRQSDTLLPANSFHFIFLA